MYECLKIYKRTSRNRFKIKHEENGKILFLHTCAKRNINKYSMTFYSKKTLTDVYLYWRFLWLEDTKLVWLFASLIEFGKIRCEEEIAKLMVILEDVNDY